MTEFPSLDVTSHNFIDDQDLADGLDEVLDGINQLVSATQHAHSKFADQLGFPLQQMTECQHAQLVQNLSVFANRMGQACSNPSPGMKNIEPGLAAKFAKESSKPTIDRLVQLHELSAKQARAVTKAAQSQNDSQPVALMDEFINFHVKSAWMLRALLQ